MGVLIQPDWDMFHRYLVSQTNLSKLHTAVVYTMYIACSCVHSSTVYSLMLRQYLIAWRRAQGHKRSFPAGVDIKGSDKLSAVYGVAMC